MKLTTTLSLALTISLILSGCKPIYKCGDPIPAKKSIFWGKRLKTVINERDTLCERITQRESHIIDLEKDSTRLADSLSSKESALTNLSARNVKLENDLTDLRNEKLSESERLSKALQQKSDELAEKEKVLKEREASLNKLKKGMKEQNDKAQALKKSIRDALLNFGGDELSVEEHDGKVYVSMSDKLLFQSGSDQVEAKGKDALKTLAGVMEKHPDIDILVEGHTDNIPISTAVFKDNWDLSVKRATSIVRILTTDFSLAPTRVAAAGRGEFFPKASNSTAEGRAKNRRTEIILSPKLDEMLKLIK